MKRIRKRKGLHCKDLYLPDPRCRNRQKFCSKPDCKRASKAARQRRWLSKKENKEYFRGPLNVERVQRWRKQLPGYWRRKPSLKQNALQDDCPPHPPDNKGVTEDVIPVALQEDSLWQPALVVGLIAKLTGFALQDDIASFVQNMQAYGQSILGIGPGMNLTGESDDCKKSVMPATLAAGARAV